MSLETLTSRINYLGGGNLGRINTQKLRSLQAALRNDYNSRTIRLENGKKWQCLINLNNLKPDYDKKIISVEFDAGLNAGDTFEVIDDGTHWMIYLPDLVETAYLKSEIIRCRYTIELNHKKYWIYFQGPTETAIRWGQKRNQVWNELNYSGTVYIKNTPETREYFKRFRELTLDGERWRVKVADPISVPGILELEVEEYFENTPAELPEIIRTPVQEETIIGVTTAKAGSTVGYTINPDLYNEDTHWTISNWRMAHIQEMDDKHICKVKFKCWANGVVTLTYGDYSVDITVEPVEVIVLGPAEVYPYDICEYQLNIENYETCEFSVDNTNVAKIISQADGKCKIQITTSRKGSFNLIVAVDEETYTLPVTIGSL